MSEQLKKPLALTKQNQKSGLVLSSTMLTKVTELLGQALESHEAVINAVVCTQEGVIVAAASKRQDIDPRIIATVSAAIAWVGRTTLEKVTTSSPSHVTLVTPRNHVIILIQANYYVIIVTSTDGASSFNLSEHIQLFKSLSAQIELLMSSDQEFSTANILGRVVQSIPGVTRAMLLTLDGLPLGSVGFEDDIEVAGLVGSMFANGLTFSSLTDYILMQSDDANLLIVRVDETRLLAVVYRDGVSPDICELIVDTVRQSV
ncbi:MAG: roadblock/LC7 domain-containing protein [Candidatus Thorarchaeota archaeon]|nr:roadblock/LC7 domain-containing protein [Candidatus Thorarchaeota archaeon]